jgi:hypothetical protein
MFFFRKKFFSAFEKIKKNFVIFEEIKERKEKNLYILKVFKVKKRVSLKKKVFFSEKFKQLLCK